VPYNLYVELFKILKFEGIASSGAEAKDMIAASSVLVNGIIEKQKKKWLQEIRLN